MTIYKVLLYHCNPSDCENVDVTEFNDEELFAKCQLLTWDSLSNAELFEIKSIIIDKFNMGHYANIRDKSELHLYNDGDIFLYAKELKENLNKNFIIKKEQNGVKIGKIVTKEMAKEKYDRAGLIQPFYSHDSVQPRFISEMPIDEFLQSPKWLIHSPQVGAYLINFGLQFFPIPNPNPIYDKKEKKVKIWHYNINYLKDGPLCDRFITKILKLYLDPDPNPNPKGKRLLSQGMIHNDDDRCLGQIRGIKKEAVDKLTGKVILYDNPHYQSCNGNHAVIYLC